MSAVAWGLTERVHGTSAFLFGWADSPLQRGLAQRRKEMGWFRRTPDLQAIRPDVGPQPHRRFGVTGESRDVSHEIFPLKVSGKQTFQTVARKVNLRSKIETCFKKVATVTDGC